MSATVSNLAILSESRFDGIHEIDLNEDPAPYQWQLHECLIIVIIVCIAMLQVYCAPVWYNCGRTRPILTIYHVHVCTRSASGTLPRRRSSIWSGNKRSKWCANPRSRWTRRLIGFNFLCDLVTAALSIANIVKSSLGPLGLDKMLVDNIGVRERCGVVYFPLRSLQSQTRPGFHRP